MSELDATDHGRAWVQFDFEAMLASERYKLLLATVLPRPIAWVTTQ